MTYQYKLSEYIRTGERIFVQESRLYAFNQLPEHTHLDFMEILYVLDGTGEHVLNGASVTASKGDLIFLPFGNKHTFKATSGDFVWIDIGFTSEALGEQLAAYPDREDLRFFRDAVRNRTAEPKLIRNHTRDFEYLVRDMLQEYMHAYKGYRENLELYLRVLLGKIGRVAAGEPEAPDVKASDLIRLVANELELVHYGELDMTAVAKRMCMSYKYFSRMFRKRVGIKFTDFVHKMRIEKACELLANSEMSIGDICEKSGFGDLQSFYRNFKKLTDSTPLLYRKRFR